MHMGWVSMTLKVCFSMHYETLRWILYLGRWRVSTVASVQFLESSGGVGVRSNGRQNTPILLAGLNCPVPYSTGSAHNTTQQYQTELRSRRILLPLWPIDWSCFP